MRTYITAILLFFTVSSFAQTIGGIGAQLFTDTTGGFTMPRILSLVPNSPAYDSLRATDYIIKVNGASCKNKTIEEVVAMIRGIAGTKVHITVADTKQGARPREYDLTRVSIQVAGPPDPVPAFNAWCENEAAQLKKKGFEIVKTFTSDCGNYFFNFDAEAGGYRIRVYSMEEKGPGASTPGYTAAAKVFDAGNEPSAVQLARSPSTESGTSTINQLDGSVTLNRDCIGNIGIAITGDQNKCKALYIIVYR
ncbi:MAG: ctpB [Flavipsychrobacter sp.]|jgi:hypothetical protein|nr:ctpB [Flavipsychrobacter sp.]